MTRTLCARASRAILLAAVFGLAVPAAPSFADTSNVITIPAGDLNAALETLARETGIQLLYDLKVVQGLKTHGVRSAKTPQDAITKLLEGTTLSTKTDSSGAILISAARTTSRSTSGETGGGGQRVRLSQAGEGQDSGQSASNPSENTQNSQNQSTAAEEIVVTGSHIRGATPDSSPLAIYTREDIDRSGATSTEEFMRKLPQNFSLVNSETFLNSGGSTSALSNSSRGSAVDLRGLGAGSTLVLLNGHRLAASGSDGSFIDISAIPLSAIDRVEILTDGASAIYGSDAVAGVVNFVLSSKFDGDETRLRYGDSTQGGGRDFRMAQTLGRTGDGGSALLSYEYHDVTAIDFKDRKFSSGLTDPYDLTPSQRENSILLNLTQRLSATTEWFGDFVYSNRDFDQQYNIYDVLPSDEQGTSRSLSANVGIDQALGHDWHGRVSANVSTNEQFLAAVQSGVRELESERAGLQNLDLQVDGPLFAWAPGEVRASAGASVRGEKFREASTDLRRTVTSGFAEVLIPVLRQHAGDFERRVDISAAVRYDHYSDAGSSTDPKLGIAWKPLPGLNLRGTVSTAYRVAPLDDIGAKNIYYIYALANPAAGNQQTVTLFPAGPSNPDLRPETATSYTLGFDLRPAALKGLNLSLTYYDIRYVNRIERPLPVGEIFNLFSHVAELGPYLNQAPTLTEVDNILTTHEVKDLVGGSTPASIQAIANVSLQNVAKTTASGLDLSLSYQPVGRLNRLAFFLNANYIQHLDFQNTALTPVQHRFNIIYSPTRVRANAGATWLWPHTSLTAQLNYANSYTNDEVAPEESIASYVTCDVQLRQEIVASPQSMVSGLTLLFDVQNIADRDPPFVRAPAGSDNFGFDSTNASPRGRFISLELQKKW